MKRATWLVGAFSLLLLASTSLSGAGEKGTASDKVETIQGCLADGPAAGWYVLTVKKADKKEQVKVRGNDSFEGHIGHEVKLTGSWAEGEGGKHFHATAMQHMAGSCR